MAQKYAVPLSELVREHDLVPIHTSADFEKAMITSMAVGRDRKSTRLNSSH